MHNRFATTRLTTVIVLIAGMSYLPAGLAAQENSEQLNQLKAEAIGIVKKFTSTLKPQLKHAMQTGGPTLAINVCSVQAPSIASNLSTESGWTVKRVSLKPRNNSLATADAWEAGILQNFDSRQQNGEPVNKLVHAEIIEGQYRLMIAWAFMSLY